MYRYMYRAHVATEDDVLSITIPLTWCMVGYGRTMWDTDRWWIRQQGHFNNAVKTIDILPEDVQG